MRFFVFGNPDLEVDALPVQLLPELRKEFVDVSFEVLDPNEEWDVPKHMNIIDTVVGIDEVTVFEDLNTFIQTPKMTCHDFDAYSNLQFLKKLGKIESVYIIGIPSGIPKAQVKTRLYKAIEMAKNN